MRSPCNGAKGCPYAPVPVIRWAKDEHGKRAVLSFTSNLNKNHRMSKKTEYK
jgi:hypothetical protein